MASFQVSGKTPSSIAALKIAANGLANILTASFITFTGILSCPGEFEHFNLFISLLRRCSSTLLKAKRGTVDDKSVDKYCR